MGVTQAMNERATQLAVGLLFAAGLAAPFAAAASERPQPRQRDVLTRHDQPIGDPQAEALPATSSPCTNGFAAGYPCHQIDLLSFLPRSELGDAQATLNDLWGWTDEATGREYALVGMSSGTSFVDVTDPLHPRLVGRMPTATVAMPWRDVKVYRDHAFVVADGAGLHGMQIFDLRRLRGAGAKPVVFEPDLIYYGPGLGFTIGELLGSAHNVAIDTDTGYAYVLGSDTCSAGLHMVDISDPENPRFAGCFRQDGYTHDAQCVIYHGADGRYIGHEICFDSDEDTLTLVDVSDKSAPKMLSRTGYQGVGYTHQGWLTEGHQYFLLGDELDEREHGFNTRTYVWDVRDLRNPRVIGVYTGPTKSIDHNLYVEGNLVYEANYRSGLRILDARGIADGELRELAYFDIVPADDEPEFSGAWSVYPWFASGNLIVSGIEQGLYVLRAHPLLTGSE
jgi:choice-of-anchor B domain-containing protein